MLNEIILNLYAQGGVSRQRIAEYFEILDKNEKIRGQSLVTVASMGIGITIGNLLGGMILDSKGVPAMLIVSTVFSFLGFVNAF